jgi:phage-related protein
VAADLRFDVQALDRASATFIRMAEQVERLARRLDDIDRRRVRAEVDVDTRRAERQIGTFDRSLGDAIIRVSTLSRALRTVALPGAILAAAPQLLSLAGAAAEAAGALLLLPAAGVTAGVAIGTLVVGLQGFGEAMKNLDDPEKFAEAIANLAPAAREAAVMIRDLGAEWTRLRLDVQQRLFLGVAEAIQQLSHTYLPVLADAMGRVADSFNRAAHQVTQFLLAGPTVAAFTVGLSNVENAIENLSDTAVPLARIFTDIFVVGSEFLPGLAAGFAGVVERVADFVAAARETGQLAVWIQNGIDTIGQLFELVGNAGGVLRGLFSAASESGTDFLGTLVDVTGLMDEFLNSGVGHDALVVVFTTINGVVAALLPAILAVGAAIGEGVIALGPALVPLADAIAQVAIAVAPLVTDLAKLTAVVLPPLTATLATIGPLMGPVVAGFLAMAAAQRLIAIFTGLNAALMAYVAAQYGAVGAALVGTGVLAPLRAAVLALNAALVANPIGLIVTGLIGLGAALVFAYNHFDGFRSVVDTAFGAVRDVALAVVNWFTGPFVDGVVSAVTAVGNWFQKLPGNIGAALSALGTAVAAGAAAAWGWLVTSAQQAGANVLAFLANLPNNIAYALGALAGTLVRAAIDGWAGFTSGITTGVAATVAFVQELPGRIVAGLSALAGALAGAATSGWQGFTSGVADAFTATVGFVQSVPGLIVAGLAGLAAALAGSAATAGNGFLTGISTAFQAVVAFFVALPGRIVAALGAAGTWLLQVGHDVIGGLLTGLGNAATAVWGWITGMVSSFVQGFKSALGIASPSTVFAQIGAWIIEGLLNGLRAVAQTVLGFLTGLGQSLVAAFTASVTALQNLWSGLWSTISSVTSTAATAVRSIISAGLNAILSVFGVSTSQINAVWSAFWNMLSQVASTIFNLIRAGIDVVWEAIRALFTGNTAALEQAWRNWWNLLSSVATAVWNAISAFIGQVWAGIRAQFDAAISAVSGAWRGFWDGLSSVATTVFGAIRNTVTTVADAIIATFRRVVDTVGSVWGGIRALLAKPINFLINTVYMGGIKKAWDTVAGVLPGLGPLPSVSPIPEYAKGGPVPRDTILRAGEAGPEYVLSSPAIRALGGLDAVDRWHQDLVASRPRDTLRDLNAGRIVEGADHNGPGTSTVGFGGVKPHVAQAGHYLRRKYGIGSVGGVGARPNASDHPKGLALDFMTSGENGTALANEVIANRAHYAVTYAIWRQRINSGGGWRPMADRGSPTANHMDHVHVSFAPGPGGVTGEGDTSGGWFDIKAWIREQLEGITNPLIDALRKAFPTPPRINEVPPAVATSIRNKGLDFLLGKAFDDGGLATGRGLMFKDVMQPERVLSPQQTLAFERMVGVLDRPRGAPSRDLGATPAISLAGVEQRLDQLLEQGVSAPTFNVYDQSGNPVETAQATKYAYLMSR